jgi:lipoprotein-anchoring transpeptidase ErfK/SrfK
MKIRVLTLSAAAMMAALSIGTVAAARLPAFTPYAATAAAMPAQPAEADTADVNPEHRRQVVDYPGHAATGTVIVDTAQTKLYFILGGGKAIRYAIGVGRDGFGWSGAQTVTRKAEWPDWTPPQEMIARQPYLARWMAGGEGNPLGARAIYLGSTVYRIHGTNMPETIGQKVSSGCIRMINADVIDLYERVTVGTRIVVLPDSGHAAVAAPALSGRASAPHGGALRTSAIY